MAGAEYIVSIKLHLYFTPLITAFL